MKEQWVQDALSDATYDFSEFTSLNNEGDMVDDTHWEGTLPMRALPQVLALSGQASTQ